MHPVSNQRLAWIAAGITLLALALRWYFVTVTVVISPIRGDAIQYFACAWNLAYHGVFSTSAPHAAVVVPDSFRDPGFPALLAVWLKLFGDHGQGWYAGILRTQALLGALTVLLVMLVGRRWLSLPWLAAAGVLAALWPHNIAMTADLLSETLFGFLCALALWLLTVALEKRSRAWMAAAGLVLGCASLTNAMLTPFFLLLVPVFFWRAKPLRRLLIVLLISAALLPGLWQARGLTLASHDSAQRRALINLVQGSWPAYHEDWRILVVHGNPRGAVLLQPIDASQTQMLASPAAGFKAMFARFATQPWRYVAWYVWHKPVALWGWNIRMGQGDIYEYPVVNSPFMTHPIGRLIAALCYALNRWIAVAALAGVMLLLRRRATTHDAAALAARAVGWATALLLLYATLIYAIFQAEPRYAIPFRGFEMLAAITALAALTRWVAARRAATSTKSRACGVRCESEKEPERDPARCSE